MKKYQGAVALGAGLLLFAIGMRLEDWLVARMLGGLFIGLGLAMLIRR